MCHFFFIGAIDSNFITLPKSLQSWFLILQSICMCIAWQCRGPSHTHGAFTEVLRGQPRHSWDSLTLLLRAHQPQNHWCRGGISPPVLSQPLRWCPQPSSGLHLETSGTEKIRHDTEAKGWHCQLSQTSILAGKFASDARSMCNYKLCNTRAWVIATG